MRRVLAFLTFILVSSSTWATPSLLAPRKSVSLANEVSGKESSFLSDGFTYLKIETDPEMIANSPTWFLTVSMMTKAGTQLNNSKFRTSRSVLFQNVSLKLPSSQKIIDTHTKENVFSNPELSFVIEGRYKVGAWDFLQIYFVDENGFIVDHEGRRPPESPFRYYKLSTKVFDVQMAEGMIRSLDSVNDDPLDTFYCPLKFDPDSAVALETSVRPKPRPVQNLAPLTSVRPKPRPKPQVKPQQTAVAKPKAKSKSTYEELMEKRAWFLKTYPKFGDCLNALRNYEKERGGNLWPSSVSIKQRASRIYDQAKKTYSSIKSHPEVVQKKNIGTGYKETHNPHMIHPLLSPELMSCIAFQETKGKLDPQAMNYSYCEKRHPMRSSAFGLSMMTRTTLSNLRYYKPHGKVVNQIPITTVKEINGHEVKENLSLDNLTYDSSDSVEMQMELMARTLNYNLKHYNWQKQLKGNSDKTLSIGVLKYDADDKEKYQDNVINRCLPCMKNIKANGGDPLSCHNKMRN